MIKRLPRESWFHLPLGTITLQVEDTLSFIIDKRSEQSLRACLFVFFLVFSRSGCITASTRSYDERKSGCSLAFHQGFVHSLPFNTCGWFLFRTGDWKSGLSLDCVLLRPHVLPLEREFQVADFVLRALASDNNDDNHEVSNFFSGALHGW